MTNNQRGKVSVNVSPEGFPLSWRRPITSVLLLLICWYSMMATHELGHVLAGWLSSHEISEFSFPLIGFSETSMNVYPRPAWVVWSGFASGVLSPLVVWLLTKRFKPEMARACQFVLGFCLLANGGYLGFGWIDRVGDIDELLIHGTPVWLLMIIGVALILWGRWCWVRLNTPSPKPPAAHSAGQ